MYASSYADVFAGDDRWKAIEVPGGDAFAWDEDSTYVRRPPYFEGMSREPAPLTDIAGALGPALGPALGWTPTP